MHALPKEAVRAAYVGLYVPEGEGEKGERIKRREGEVWSGRGCVEAVWAGRGGVAVAPVSHLLPGPAAAAALDPRRQHAAVAAGPEDPCRACACAIAACCGGACEGGVAWCGGLEEGLGRGGGRELARERVGVLADVLRGGRPHLHVARERERGEGERRERGEGESQGGDGDGEGQREEGGGTYVLYLGENFGANVG